MHTPVLVREVVEHLGVCPNGVILDGTLGAGGHAKALLEAAGSKAILIGIDRDEGALERARKNLGPLAQQVHFVHGAFADMSLLTQAAGFPAVDCILCDLGFSSDQVDDAARGFSFMADGPLDMRLDRSQLTTAADLVNNMPEAQLADLIFELGDEPASRRIEEIVT